MATALGMINKSLRLIGAIGQGKAATATEAADALDALNMMLESWSIERLSVYHLYDETVSWTASQASRTIGSGGNFNTTRPTKIEDGFTRISNVDYSYRSITKQEYDSISDKTTQGSYPEVIAYDPVASLGVLYAYPVPSATVSIHIMTWKQLQSFTALTDVVALPPGYRRAIEYNLAIELQGEYPDLAIPESVVRIATQSKAALKSANITTLISNLGLGGSGRYDIYSDT